MTGRGLCGFPEVSGFPTCVLNICVRSAKENLHFMIDEFKDLWKSASDENTGVRYLEASG